MDLISKLMELIRVSKGDFVYPESTSSRPDFTFWKSPRGRVLIINSRQQWKFLALTEELILQGYVLSGGIQQVQWSETLLGNRATFVAPE